MKLFNPASLATRPLPVQLTARMVGLDIQLMRFAEPSRRGPFRATLRSSIRTLREQIRRAQ